MKASTSKIAAAAGVLLLASVAISQAQTVTPNKGQTPDQMAADQQECSAQATSQTGYNPAAPPAPAAPSGNRVKGAARGAAVGAAASGVTGGEAYDRASDNAKQEYRQNQAKDAAKVGVVVGGMKNRQDRRDTRNANQSASAAWDGAYRSCLTSRGYTVK